VGIAVEEDMTQSTRQFGDLSLTTVVTSPPWYENCYIVRHVPSGALVVVDPGGDSQRVIAAIEKEGGAPQAIWLTHGHPDHVGAARAIEAKFAIPTRYHATEAPVLARASDLNRAFSGEPLEGPSTLESFDGEPSLDLGGHPVRVILCPGHTPGGVVFDFGAFALTGDTLFMQGVGRTDLPGGSERQLWASINRLLTLLPDEAMLYSGHGPEWPAREARRWWRLMA
jgi:glyoxylase-like metal-dependent hydrolase (beta-lactamase superfamily II)